MAFVPCCWVMSPNISRLRQVIGSRGVTRDKERAIRDAGDWPTGKPMPFLKRGATTQLHPITVLQGHGPRVAIFFTFAREARNMNFQMEFPEF